MAAESVTDQVVNLLRSVASHVEKKMSGILVLLFNNKNAGSFGAIAGFALAIVFAWKFLQSPEIPPCRKQRNTPSSNSGLANVQPSNSEVYPRLLNVKDLDATEVINHPVEVKKLMTNRKSKCTLGQVVRKKLSGSRKITCQLLGVILEERTPDELQKRATVRPSVLEVLSELIKLCDVYLMETVLNDESEERVLVALEDAGLFKVSGLVKDKVLFCSTENGRGSFVRQLEPDWHIDTNPEIVSNLSRFIRYQLHVSPAASSCLASNISTCSSLEQYFSCL